ncbi:MAG: nucleotidyltransferase family protein [Steroidobacteraceae bacterium]
MSTASDSDLPPEIGALTALQARLRRVTETLAHELARPSAAGPDWSETEWLLARAVATIHGVSPLLARSLRWQGPPGWQAFLEDQRTHTVTRHERIRELLRQLHDAGRSAGLVMIALKGAALHDLQLYAPGERPMADVDLLVRQQDAPRAGQVLADLGFHWTHTNFKHQVFERGEGAPSDFGENSTNGMKIEVHSHIREALPRRIADISACIFPRAADPRATEPGLNYYPSRSALMLHLLLHAAGAMAGRAVRLIHLNDISRLAASMSSRDWDELLTHERTLNQTLWWAFPPLAMTARYYDSIPEHVVTTLAPRCQWWLRRVCDRRSLCDVSLSHLWVTAFPGIEWARSPREMLTYVVRRVAPDAQVRSLRKVLATIEPAAAQSTWAHMSQGRRLFRWLTSRPARPEALRPIRMALASRVSGAPG